MAGTRKEPAERRAELIAATAALMLERGFGAVTTREVTSRVGVGSGLLNHYFPWEELRRLGFEAVAREGTSATFPGTPAADPVRRLRRLIRESFSRHADPYWRVWVEAIDEAAADRELAAVVGRCAESFRSRFESLLRDGVDSRAWSCADPTGAPPGVCWRCTTAWSGSCSAARRRCRGARPRATSARPSRTSS